MSEENLFLIDTELNEDEIELNEAPVPVFSSTKFILGLTEIDKDDNLINSDNEDEYYGLPPPSVNLSEALEKCPIQVTYFKQKSHQEEPTTRKFKDKLLCSLDEHLEELRIKNKHTFVTEGIETKRDISRLAMSDRQLARIDRKEREKTKGKNWFNMKAPEMTEELKNELQVLQMRSALDPKHFYKRSEMKSLPKYFEIGKVVDSPVEYHSTKDTRKRKKTLVDELLEDAVFQKQQKKKYKEVVEVQSNSGYKKAMKKMNKLKKRK